MSDFSELREQMVHRYFRAGYIKSSSMAEATRRVPREEFMDPTYVDYAYVDQPFPIPGDGKQTISAPYMYPIFYEPLDLIEGNKVLEVGAGSGYGAALAQELVGSTGLVVSIEINETTFSFARENLVRTGYSDVVLVQGDGSLGYPEKAPYDAICVTAACPAIPQPLIEQLGTPGKLIAPVGSSYSIYGQDLVVLKKNANGVIGERRMMKVSYVPLTGEYGYGGNPRV
jgi:protein-L-isoaspartate(D-aspartate) O-methyltransferase